MSQITENETARYTVETPGGTFSQSSPNGLQFIAVEDHVDMIGMCELTFEVGDENADWSAMTVGGDISIVMGGDSRKLFVGNITGSRHAFQKGKNTLTVIAMDPLHKLAASRETVTYLEKKDSEVASQVIGQAGVPSGTIDATTRVYPYILQRNESNYTFLRRLAARNDYLLMANEGKIDFKKPQFSGGGSEIPKDKLISMDYNMNPRDVPSQVTAMGWDYANKQPIVGTASSGDITPIGGGRVPAGDVFTGDAVVSDVWVDDQNTAKEMASAQLNREARNFLRGRAVIQGDAAFHGGSMAKFSGHAGGFNAEVYVISSRHKIYVRGGFTSELVFCSNTMPQ